MTDLERLWESLAARPAPVDDILRAGRASLARRSRAVLLRPLVAVGAVAALGAAFVVGTTVGGGSSGSHPSSDSAAAGGSDASPVAFRADLKPAASCDALLDAYRTRALPLVTAYGWGGRIYPRAVQDFTLGAPQAPGAPGALHGEASSAAGAAAAPTVKGQGSSATGTNVQEAGVDEPDTVKTDGHLLVRIHEGSLQVYDVAGSSPVERGTLPLDGVSDPQLLLKGDTVVVLGGDTTAPPDEPATSVLTVSVADPAVPKVTDTTTYRSSLLSARQHGDVVRLVLDAGLPDLDFVQPGDHRTQKEALDANRALVEKSTLKDWLPTYRAGPRDQQLLDCHDVAVPPAALGLDTVSIVGFTLADPGRPHAIGLAGATTIAYESADDLYLAATPSTGIGICGRCIAPLGGAVAGGPTSGPGAPIIPGRQTGRTSLFDFHLDGVNAIHVASGEVNGIVRDRWSMDSADGSLRVAVGPSVSTANANAIVTLRRDGQRLVEDGRLDGIGAGQQIESVRWFDTLAIVVTYRQMDPLYTVDLTDPAHPRQLGALEMPGFSSYLHPLGANRLMGVGTAGIGEAQIGLFGTADLTHVRRLSTVRFGRTTSALAGDNPAQFTWLPSARTALTVIERGDAGELAVVHVADGRLTSRLVPIGFGADISEARTLPLPDGRVVLSTGSAVSFLPL